MEYKLTYTTLLALFFIWVSSSFAVSVDFLDEQKNNSSNTGMRIRVNNDFGRTLKNVSMRYYFHSVPGKNVVVDTYYAPNVHFSIQTADSVTQYIQFSMDSVEAGYFPNKSGMSFGLHYSDWSSWDKSLDFSYSTANSIESNERIALYENQNLVFGEVSFSEEEKDESENIDAAKADIDDVNPKGEPLIDISTEWVADAAVISMVDAVNAISFYKNPNRSNGDVYLDVEVSAGKKRHEDD